MFSNQITFILFFCHYIYQLIISCEKQLMENLNFFYVGPNNVVHLFHHLLWSIFQSVLQAMNSFTIWRSLYRLVLGIYNMWIISIISHETLRSLQQIQPCSIQICYVIINNLPLPTSVVPSQCATNWAIQAWIWNHN